MPTSEATSDKVPLSKQSLIIDRATKILNFAKSLFALAAAFAALLLASSSEARRTSFTIYVISRMWVEITIVAIIWLSVMLLKALIRRMHASAVSLSLRDFLDLRLLLLAIIGVSIIAMYIPPLTYIGVARYRFWSSQVQRRYIEQLKGKVAGEVRVGMLDSALHTIAVGSEVLKGSSGEGSFKDITSRLGAAVDRSKALDDESTDAWNFVTQRERFYSLVEAVRVDPENSSAADHLTHEMRVISGYLNDDAKGVCALQTLPATFSGKAIALVEARRLWTENEGSQLCVDQVLRELRDGWAIGPISCVLKQSDLIRQGTGAVSLDPKSCPPGVDFWTPLSLSPDEDITDQDEDTSSANAAERYPIYPTFGSLWRRFRSYRLRHATPAEAQ